MSESLEDWKAEALRLRQAIEDARSQLASTGCPLCTYIDGKITKPCTLHAEVDRLNLQVSAIKAIEKRIASSPKEAEKVVQDIYPTLKALSDDERKITFSGLWGMFCRTCYRLLDDGRRCHCWNDE